MRASALLLLAGLGCAESATLTIDPLSPETCKAHCVASVQVELDGVGSSHLCGQPIDLGLLEADRTYRLVVTATGAYGLRAEADVRPVPGQPTDLTLRLEPMGRPVIESVRIASGDATLYGEGVVSIEGVGFGMFGPNAKVTIEGSPVAIAQWNDTAIEVLTDRGGAVVVEQCGVASEVVVSQLGAVRLHEVEATVPGCERPRFVSLAAVNGAPGQVLAAVGCGATCSSTRLVRFASAAPEQLEVAATIDGCPIDLTSVTDALSFVSTEAGLFVCTGSEPGACNLRSSDGRFESLSRVQQVATAAIHRPPGSATRQLRFETTATAGSGVLLLAELDDVHAIDGRFVLGTSAQAAQPVLMRWAPPAPASSEARLLFPACVEPRLLRRYRSSGGDEHLSVLCGTPNDLFLRIIEVTAGGMFDIVSAAFTIRASVPIDMDVDEAGEVLWIWTPEALVFFDLDRGTTIGRFPLSSDYEGKRLIRADDEGRFFLGGPGSGRLTWLAVE